MVRPLCLRPGRRVCRSAKAVFALVPLLLASSQAVAQLRVVSYNNSGDNSNAGAGLAAVLTAIGSERRGR